MLSENGKMVWLGDSWPSIYSTCETDKDLRGFHRAGIKELDLWCVLIWKTRFTVLKSEKNVILHAYSMTQHINFICNQYIKAQFFTSHLMRVFISSVHASLACGTLHVMACLLAVECLHWSHLG